MKLKWTEWQSLIIFWCNWPCDLMVKLNYNVCHCLGDNSTGDFNRLIFIFCHFENADSCCESTKTLYLWSLFHFPPNFDRWQWHDWCWCCAKRLQAHSHHVLFRFDACKTIQTSPMSSYFGFDRVRAFTTAFWLLCFPKPMLLI